MTVQCHARRSPGSDEPTPDDRIPRGGDVQSMNSRSKVCHTTYHKLSCYSASRGIIFANNEDSFVIVDVRI